MVGSIQEVARETGSRLMLHSTGADAEDELAMVRDLKHRFVDGLILVLAATSPTAHVERARARGGAGRRDRRGPPKGTRVDTVRAVLAQGRGRGRAPPARASAGGGSRSSTGRSTRCPARSRRLGYLDGLRSCGLERDDALIEVADDFMVEPGPRARPSACSPARGPTRSSAPTTCSRSARSRRCATRGLDVPRRRGARGDGQHARSPSSPGRR